jgi:hypothetical protein
LEILFGILRADAQMVTGPVSPIGKHKWNTFMGRVY